MADHSIRKGSNPSKEEGGMDAPTGDGANVQYPKNEGTSDDKSGGKNSAKGDKSGLDVSIGKG